MFNPSREQVRRFFVDAWAGYRVGRSLSGNEAVALEVILAHPEYHTLLENPARHLDRDYLPEMGETNPFLHLAMHLSLAEQLSIDQPAGVRTRYEKLLAQHGDAMHAQHDMMDCLAEMIWQAQRTGTAYDPLAYLQCLDAKLGSDMSR